MSKLAPLTHAVLISLLGAMTSAAATLPSFTLAAQTQHFSFYSRGAKVDAQKSEKYLAKVEALLGTDFEGQAQYYRHENAQQIAVATGSYAQGVTYMKRKEIHSAQEFHAHEIVHLVAGQMGDPGTLFHEGLAVALSADGRWNGQSIDKAAKKALQGVAVADLLDRFDRMDPQQAYAAAGSFVASLIKAYGVEKVSAFFRSCTRPAARNAAFEKTFGLPLDQAAGAWAQNL
jgi:hypothetical protein